MFNAQEISTIEFQGSERKQVKLEKLMEWGEENVLTLLENLSLRKLAWDFLRLFAVGILSWISLSTQLPLYKL